MPSAHRNLRGTSQLRRNLEISTESSAIGSDRTEIAAIQEKRAEKMSHLTRVWMAASVAVMQGHSEGGLKSMSVRCSLQSASNHVVSASAGAAATASGLGVGRALRGAGAEDRRNQVDDSLQKVMYLSCWGPS
ncbi:hypothetical protein ZIOFF_073989 [Zingiber officinale]|uniref:Uncharacterized protein n=1 Tax=Zingiber officinale TaxID=94328 RepID=A0A8J5C6R8_ZINOF|nr:hypothetical protein ZIOFF_073989 [Zingiber officinale]